MLFIPIGERALKDRQASRRVAHNLRGGARARTCVLTSYLPRVVAGVIEARCSEPLSECSPNIAALDLVPSASRLPQFGMGGAARAEVLGCECASSAGRARRRSPHRRCCPRTVDASCPSIE